MDRNAFVGLPSATLQVLREGGEAAVVDLFTGNPLALAGHNPLASTFALALMAAAISLVLSWLTGDYSWTDRLWSITPAVYVWVFATGGGLGADFPIRNSPRLLLLAGLASLWAGRLTYNFARKGGYSPWSGEDYRWKDLQQRWLGTGIVWHLFNVIFIALYQHLLLWALTVPAYATWRFEYFKKLSGEASPLFNTEEMVLAVVFIGLVIFEGKGDGEQWTFQQGKYNCGPRYAQYEHDYKRGFNTTGLFRLTRHPNYFAEISLWWVFALLCMAGVPHTTTDSAFFCSGAALLTLLIFGSTKYTEMITSEKYPLYEDYQRTTSMFVPMNPSGDVPRVPKVVVAADHADADTEDNAVAEDSETGSNEEQSNDQSHQDSSGDDDGPGVSDANDETEESEAEEEPAEPPPRARRRVRATRQTPRRAATPPATRRSSRRRR